MSVRLQRDVNINFYKENLGKIDASITPSEDMFLYYKGWIESIMLKANPILDRMSNKDKEYFLKHERLPKIFQNTPFGEAYEKLEDLIEKMLGYEYSKNPHPDCMKFFTSCEKYVDNVVKWLSENEAQN